MTVNKESKNSPWEWIAIVNVDFTHGPFKSFLT